MLIIPAVRRLRQEGLRFKTSLGYIVRACLSPSSSQREKPLRLRSGMRLLGRIKKKKELTLGNGIEIPRKDNLSNNNEV
jgi:hypothetical protein